MVYRGLFHHLYDAHMTTLAVSQNLRTYEDSLKSINLRHVRTTHVAYILIIHFNNTPTGVC